MATHRHIRPLFTAEQRTSGEIQLIADLAHPIGGKHALVVEDIIDTGLTMSFLLDTFATCKPASVKVCTLLRKPARRLAGFIKFSYY